MDRALTLGMLQGRCGLLHAHGDVHAAGEAYALWSRSHILPVLLLASQGERSAFLSYRKKGKRPTCFECHTPLCFASCLSLLFVFFTSGDDFPAMFLFHPQDVIDGDLCEQFSSLPYEKQKLVATGLDRTVGEVVKKLEDTRNRLL